AIGQPFVCPRCGRQFIVSESQLGITSSLPKASQAASAPSFDAGGNRGMAGNPYALADSGDSPRNKAQLALLGAAIGLMVAAGIGILGYSLNAGDNLVLHGSLVTPPELSSNPPQSAAERAGYMTGGYCFLFTGYCWSTLLILGGVQMIRVKNRGLAMFTNILA